MKDSYQVASLKNELGKSNEDREILTGMCIEFSKVLRKIYKECKYEHHSKFRIIRSLIEPYENEIDMMLMDVEGLDD